jgi:hypothetical protein
MHIPVIDAEQVGRLQVRMTHGAVHFDPIAFTAASLAMHRSCSRTSTPAETGTSYWPWRDEQLRRLMHLWVETYLQNFMNWLTCQAEVRMCYSPGLTSSALTTGPLRSAFNEFFHCSSTSVLGSIIHARGSTTLWTCAVIFQLTNMVTKFVTDKLSFEWGIAIHML